MKSSLLAWAILAASALVFCAPQTKDDWHSEGVIYLANALNARLHPVPVQAVHLTDGFWSARRRVTTERSLPTLLALLEEHGAIDNFRYVDLKKIDVPTLVMHGDDDQIVPIADAGLLTAKIVKGAQLKVYPGLSHGMPIINGDQISRDLLGFIQS